MTRSKTSPRRAHAASFAIVVASVAAASGGARGDAERFVRSPRGVVDVASGLTWSYGAPRFLAWESARAHCTTLGTAWRLPDVGELSAMVLPTPSGDEALARAVFGRAHGAPYWSGEARSRRDDIHRLAVGEDGAVANVDTRSPLAVRCVRDATR